MAEFLLEIGTEEIPARMLARAVEDLKTALEQTLEAAGLDFDPLQACGGPRHLVVYARRMDLQQKDRIETIMGPPVRIAYDQSGAPSKALEGFLRKNPGLSLEHLKSVSQPKGDVVAGDILVRGHQTRDLLANAIPEILARMHFAKSMRWGDGDVVFVRPVRRILALLDNQVIPVEFGGVSAGSTTFGHRFHGAKSISVSSLDSYLEAKKEHHVILRHQDRMALIRSQMKRCVADIKAEWVPDEALLEEVADLVETPLVIVGSFQEAFLQVPREVLITSMREHQKSFCVQDAVGNLLPNFLAIASAPHDHKGLIKKGNEWVLRARLWDAKFFWESDLKKDLEALRLRLEHLTFQRELGSYLQKAERMEAQAHLVADRLDLTADARASLLEATRHAKTDLMSELVFEFPELQGIVGGLLLRHAGRDHALWQAVYEHYLPMSMDGALPKTKVGALVSLIDKLDTLVGCFAVGLIPKGAKDPYALRRAAQGVVRILAEHELPLPLDFLIRGVMGTFKRVVSLDGELLQRLEAFFTDRIRHFLKLQGYAHDLVEAVLAADCNRVDLVLGRARAVSAHQERDSFRSLALNLKRMKNVVADEHDKIPPFDPEALVEPLERELWEVFEPLRDQIRSAFDAGRFEEALDLMVPLADPVEAYFAPGGVFVNVDDERLRLSRKSMLNEMRRILSLVGDIAHLEPK